MKLRAALALAALALALPLATAAHAQPGPSLAETLSFIQGKLQARGDLNWVVTRADDSASQPHLDRVNSVDADPAGCSLTIHYTVLVNGALAPSDQTIALGKITDIQLATWSQLATGHANITIQTQPAIWTVELFFADDTRAINFPDQTIAGRVAKAVAHAVQLCGGSQKSPF
jgi:hypothetical protein